MPHIKAATARGKKTSTENCSSVCLPRVESVPPSDLLI